MSMAAGIIGMGRKQAELLMESSCTITRELSAVVNETTGALDRTFSTIYVGPCRLRYIVTRVFMEQVAAQQLAKQNGQLSIPVGAAGSVNVRPNDVATITVSPIDPALVGTAFRIEGIHSQTAATARRFLVEVLS
jgi:hypothetical protein